LKRNLEFREWVDPPSRKIPKTLSGIETYQITE